MHNVYDARRPAPGVRVDYVPRPKIRGLSISQQKALRTHDWSEGVMRPKPLCRPVKTSGGGLPAPAIVKVGTAKPLPDRIGATLERGLPRTGKAPTNLVCKLPLPKQSHYARMKVEQKLAVLRGLRRQIGQKGNPHVEEAYERMRTSFLRLHEEHRQRLFTIERGR